MREVNKESEVMDGEAFTPRNMVLQRTGNESNDNWTLAEMKPFAASVRTGLCTTPPTAPVWLAWPWYANGPWRAHGSLDDRECCGKERFKLPRKEAPPISPMAKTVGFMARSA